MADRPTPALLARPRPQPITGRRLVLLDAIRRTGGRWTTGRVRALYGVVLPSHVYRSTIRVDLRALCAAGHLVAHGGDYRRYYTLCEDAERPAGEPRAEADLHAHIVRRRGGRYEKASTT